MNDAALHYRMDRDIRIRGIPLAVLVGGTGIFAALAAAASLYPLFYIGVALLFVPFLFVNKQVTLYIYVLSFAYAVPFFEYYDSVFVRLDDVLFIVIALFWFMDKTLSEKRAASGTFLASPLLIWLGINALTAALLFPRASSIQLFKAAYLLLRLIQYTAIYFIIADFIKTERMRVVILRLLFISTVFICIYAFAQYIVFERWRVSGPLSGNHAHIGSYLLFMFFIFAAYIGFTRNIIERALVVVFLPVMVYILFLSASRAAILSLFPGVIIALLISKKPTLWVLALALTGAGIYYGGYFLENLKTYGLGTAQFQGLNPDLSTFGRVLIWFGIYQFFLHNPFALLTGVGLGNIGRSVLPYTPYKMSVTGGHNNYLHNLAETGIIGLAVFLYIMYALLKTSLRRAYDTARRDRALYYGYFCGLAALLFASLTQETFSVQPSMFNFLGFFFLVTAVIFAEPAAEEHD